MKTARQVIEKFVINYLKEHWDELKEKSSNPSFQEAALKQLVKDIKKNPTDLEWTLGEILGRSCDNSKIKESIVHKEKTEDDKFFITVYKIKNKFIKETLPVGSNYLIDSATYEFVKLKKKKIVIYEYESIK